jgi:hypothetical protein
MKKLLVLSLVLVMAGAAVAQNYEYYPCQNRVGIFFGEPYGVEQTNFDYTAFVPFNVYLVSLSVSDPIAAYELRVGLDAGFVITAAVFPNAINFGGSNTNHIVGYGAPVPGSGEWNAVHLSTLTLLWTGAAGTPSVITLGPSVPSSIANDGPAYVINGVLVRSNFTTAEFSGCDGCEYEPGNFDVIVGTFYGDGIELECVVSTQNHSLSSVKALFQ